MQNSDGFEASFARVKSRFVSKLAKWLPELNSNASLLRHGGLPAHVLQDLSSRVHKIAGSARTFGLPVLNDRAVELERGLLAFLGASPTHTVSVDVVDLLDGFIAEVQAGVELAGADAQGLSSAPVPDYVFTYQVLVADDDEHIADVLEYALAERGCRILRAINGDDALALAAGNTALLDLIVLDVNMPGKSGFDVLDALKANPHTARIPVIMLTRRDEDENLIRGISAGALDYIIKPFESSVLAKRISLALAWHKTKILIADDDELIRELLAQKFQREGYSVLLAATGIDAWQVMQTQKPDVAIIDVMMPGMDGFSVLNKAKNNSETTDIPVVMLTAKGQQENVLQGLEGGAHDYVVKPFDLDQLAARITGILRRSNSARR